MKRLASAYTSVRLELPPEIDVSYSRLAPEKAKIQLVVGQVSPKIASSIDLYLTEDSIGAFMSLPQARNLVDALLRAIDLADWPLDWPVRDSTPERTDPHA